MANMPHHTTALRAELAELVRPRFFAGQLLTDRDLTALEEWVRSRFALRRHHDGWGVVCGLGVRFDPNKPSRLIVTPGYAVDCPGNDLVLGEETGADLPRADDRPGGRCPYPEPTTGSQEGTFSAGPWEELPLNRLAVFDLLFYYHPTPVDPVAALAVTGGRRCEYTRTQEAAKLRFVRRSWEEVGEVGRPKREATGDEAVQLLQDFEKVFEAKLFGAPEPSPGQGEDGPKTELAKVYEWLVERLRKKPALVRTFPTLKDWLDPKKAQGLATPWGVARILFWMTDALRRACLSCGDCADAPDGVPLARVWAERDGSGFKIRLIDDAPPYRKVIGPDLTAGVLRSRTYVGRRWEEVREGLARLGIPALSEWAEPPAGGQQLLRLFQSEPAELSPNVPVVAVVSRRERPEPGDKELARPEPFAGRVVAFRTDEQKRRPVTLPGAALEVRLFLPEAAAEVVPTFQDPPLEDMKLDCLGLPVGGHVRMAVGMRNFDFTTPPARTFTAFCYDELRNKIYHVGEANGSQPIVTTFQVPDVDVGEDVELAVLIKESVAGKDDRFAAVTGKVGKPISEHEFAGTGAPTLKVAPLAGKEGELVVLQGGKPLINVQMSNPSPSAIQGELRLATSNPAQLLTAVAVVGGGATAVGAVSALAGTALGPVKQDKHLEPEPKPVVGGPGLIGPIVSIELDAAATEGWFWVTAGKDAFLRDFRIDPGSAPQLGFQHVNLKAAVQNVSDPAGGQKSQLTLTNTDGAATIAIKKVWAAPLDTDPRNTDKKEVALPAGLSLAPNTPSPLLDLPPPASTRWRLWVDFNVGNQDRSGVIDVAVS